MIRIRMYRIGVEWREIRILVIILTKIRVLSRQITSMMEDGMKDRIEIITIKIIRVTGIIAKMSTTIDGITKVTGIIVKMSVMMDGITKITEIFMKMNEIINGISIGVMIDLKKEESS